MDKTKYKISELAEAAGVTVRTIRYYVSKGLLTPPIEDGMYSYYSEINLKELKLIKAYQEKYLPLDVIREKLLKGEKDVDINLKEDIHKSDTESLFRKVLVIPGIELSVREDVLDKEKVETLVNYIKKIINNI
ncbi:MAG: MerR family transcriptional regulator [Acholeplasmataceae bacterium]|nr:MerR family transcriptional regulator [Acholeplasmataceae bacterium]